MQLGMFNISEHAHCVLEPELPRDHQPDWEVSAGFLRESISLLITPSRANTGGEESTRLVPPGSVLDRLNEGIQTDRERISSLPPGGPPRRSGARGGGGPRRFVEMTRMWTGARDASDPGPTCPPRWDYVVKIWIFSGGVEAVPTAP